MRLKVDNCFLKHGNIILFRKLLQLLETVDLNWILFSFLFTKTLGIFHAFIFKADFSFLTGFYLTKIGRPKFYAGEMITPA